MLHRHGFDRAVPAAPSHGEQAPRVDQDDPRPLRPPEGGLHPLAVVPAAMETAPSATARPVTCVSARPPSAMGHAGQRRHQREVPGARISVAPAARQRASAAAASVA